MNEDRSQCMMYIFKYFPKVQANKQPDERDSNDIDDHSQQHLPSPSGSLSLQVPSSNIEAANERVQEELSRAKSQSKRGKYAAYSAQDKARIGNYAVLHGSIAAVRSFKKEFPSLKRTTVNEWRDAVVKLKQRNHKEGIDDPIRELHGKKRGRPSTLSTEILDRLKLYLTELRKAGGTVNSAIVLAAAHGITQRADPTLLQDGSLGLSKTWVKYFLKQNDFVKRKATTKAKVSVSNFNDLQQQFLLDIKAVVDLEEIPPDLTINWDQTGINYVPVSQWTMEKRGCKRVEVAGINDKRQITAVLGGSLAGDFLPVQLVYQGKTNRCLPRISFPSDWHITCTPNHWCNEKTVQDYIEQIIIPYVLKKKNDLGLPITHPALVIFDEFNGQTTDNILKLLTDNHIYYVIVPPNTTDRLQPPV